MPRRASRTFTRTVLPGAMRYEAFPSLTLLAVSDRRPSQTPLWAAPQMSRASSLPCRSVARRPIEAPGSGWIGPVAAESAATEPPALDCVWRASIVLPMSALVGL